MFFQYKQIDMKAQFPILRVTVVFALGLFFTSPVNAEGVETLYSNIAGYRFVEGEAPTALPAALITQAPRVGYWQRFSAILFGSDGRIKKVYLDDKASQHASKENPELKIIDGQGRYVLPGLIDAHGHVLSLGQRYQRVNLVDTRSVSEAQQRIAEFIAEDKTSPWILGRGWNQVLWPGKNFPTSADIDEIETQRPVYLARIDGHAAWANSAALKAAGINSHSKDPQGGQILKDKLGNPTGLLIDNAMNLVEAVIPKPSIESVTEALQLAQKELRELGITSVHDAGVDFTLAELYRQEAEKHALTVRIYGMVSGAGDELSAVKQPWPAGKNDLFSLTSVKLYADGALGSRGAAMLEPYSDQANHFGLLFSPYDDLKLQVKRAVDLGFQVNVHAIGDAANHQVLDIFSGLDKSTLRHRIEHSQILTLPDIKRFAELGIIASMQPVHATSDMNMAEDRIGKERIAGAYAWRQLLDLGVVIAAGSDFPVELSNPFHGLYAAVARKDHNGNPDKGWYAGQAMNRAEALRAFTVDAAYAAHQEDRLGNLKSGYWADFIVLDKDFFTIEENSIWHLDVAETWLGGQRVYEKMQTPQP